MKESVQQRLEQVAARHEEVGLLLSQPDVLSNQDRFRELSIEYAQLQPVVDGFQKWKKAREAELQAEQMTGDADPELRALANQELQEASELAGQLDDELQRLLLPRDPNDELNIFLEIRAGTGGDEAALFAGDLFRMYQRFVESRKWRLDVLSASEGEHGGFKEIIALVEGKGAFSWFKFESGTHRVQRVPETESQGRIHTSACTVAILPETRDIESVDIDPSDLRIDTYRSSGAGGQHVNKTDSAIRITHFPSGIVVECQDERSQHKNKARAMSLLHARLLEQEQTRQQSAKAEARRLQVGSGDRSQRIRTYNFPQGRVTDHRINLTLYKLDEFLAGNLDLVVKPLMQEQQALLMAELGD